MDYELIEVASDPMTGAPFSYLRRLRDGALVPMDDDRNTDYQIYLKQKAEQDAANANA